MIKDIDVKLTSQEVQAIISALKHVDYSKCNFKYKDILIDKLKGKNKILIRNKYEMDGY